MSISEKQIHITLIFKEDNVIKSFGDVLKGVDVPFTTDHVAVETPHDVGRINKKTDIVFISCSDTSENGKAFMHAIRSAGINAPVVVLVKTADAHSAVKMMKMGAFDYIPEHEITVERITYVLQTGQQLRKTELARQKAVLDLEESRHRLLEAQMLARVSSYEYNISTREITISESFHRLFRLPRRFTRLSGDELRTFIHPEDLSEALSRFLACAEMGVEFRHEFRALLPDGKVFYLSGAGVRKLDENGNPLKIVGTVQDITAQKNTENTLRENESLLRSINRNIKEGIYRSTRDDGLIYANQAFATMFGYDSPEEMKSISVNSLYADPTMRKQILQNLERGIDRSNDEILFMRRDGTHFWGLLKSISLKEPDGNTYFDGAIVDITDRKKIEVELRKAKEAAESAAIAKSEFLSNMSHEIRTPMNAILGLIDLLLQENFRGKNLENLKAIKYSADNLLVIINDILDFSKIEAGKINFEHIDFNIQELMNDLLYTQKIRSDAKGIDLNLEIELDVPRYLKGDPYRLNQIMLNLTSNAIKFTNVGKVDVFVSKIYEDETGIGLSISVKDTGIGIPQAKINSIFESFTQAYTDTSRKYGGTGLGLAITKRLIEMQGGSVMVKSKVGIGSDFTFILKFEKGAVVRKENAHDGVSRKDLKEITVLVAEDNSMNQFVINKLLRKWNARVLMADNGTEALEVLEHSDVDVVLMDLQMPELNGYDTTKIIRDSNSLVLNHKVPIIALTADAFSETKKRVLESGFDDFVTKPFDQDTLYLKIKRQLYKAAEEENHESNELDMSEINKDGLVDLSYFREVVGDDNDMLVELLTMFLDQNPKEINDLQLMHEAGSMDDVKKLAHKMKSSLGTLGMKATVHVLSMIEKEALEGNTSRVGELVAVVTHSCDQARAEINSIIDRISAGQ